MIDGDATNSTAALPNVQVAPEAYLSVSYYPRIESSPDADEDYS